MLDGKFPQFAFDLTYSAGIAGWQKEILEMLSLEAMYASRMGLSEQENTVVFGRLLVRI
jgi:hypothetical protein